MNKSDYDIEKHNLAVQSHKDWLAHPKTSEFINRLQDFRINLLSQAENLLSSDPGNSVTVENVKKKLIVFLFLSIKISEQEE